MFPLLKLFKKLTAVIAAGALLFSCGSVLKSDSGVTGIELLSSKRELELVAGEVSAKSYFTVTGENEIKSEDIVCVNVDESIAEVVFNKTDIDGMFSYTVEAIEAGETYVCFKTSDGVISSGTIHVTVTADGYEETEGSIMESYSVYPETVAVIETADTAAETETVAETDDKYSAETEYSTIVETDTDITYYETEYYTYTEPTESTSATKVPQTSPTEVIVQPSDDPSRTVYVTPSGKRYHFSSSCAGKNGTEVTLEEAMKTKTPCKKCAGG